MLVSNHSAEVPFSKFQNQVELPYTVRKQSILEGFESEPTLLLRQTSAHGSKLESRSKQACDHLQENQKSERTDRFKTMGPTRLLKLLGLVVTWAVSIRIDILFRNRHRWIAEASCNWSLGSRKGSNSSRRRLSLIFQF